MPEQPPQLTTLLRLYDKTSSNLSLMDNITKTCTKCGLSKDSDKFPVRRTGSKDGRDSWCRECKNEAGRAWERANKEQRKEYDRKRAANPLVKEMRNAALRKRYNDPKTGPEIKAKLKAYRSDIETKQKRNRARNLRYKTDPKYKLSCLLRGRLKSVLRGESKAGSAVRDLGCTIEVLKIYLESKFQPGMTWENWSRDGWHIDHIIPLASFDLTDRERFLKACHYTNLQPLWAKQNLKKHDH